MNESSKKLRKKEKERKARLNGYTDPRLPTKRPVRKAADDICQNNVRTLKMLSLTTSRSRANSFDQFWRIRCRDRRNSKAMWIE